LSVSKFATEPVQVRFTAEPEAVPFRVTLALVLPLLKAVTPFTAQQLCQNRMGVLHPAIRRRRIARIYNIAIGYG
jgi:hypothetical protein